MSAGRATQGARLAGPFGFSLALHAALLVMLIMLRPEARAVQAPVYRVNIIAAPPGERRAGVVTRTPEPQVQKPAPIPPRARTKPSDMPALTRKPPTLKRVVPATPVPPKAPPKRASKSAPPNAGGGPTGGRGTDVATVTTEGTNFPYPGYLDNIVRQIAMRFHPPPNTAAKAEMKFLIHRDGSVTGIQFITRSGVFTFDLDAQGAVEQAGRVHAFGGLPPGFPDDVLTVIFSFDPRVLR
ncbi:MAG TPA: TonB C-terminal domain-containing protein [Gemmatimonadaceae bacterium]|nr:TonB C-terminal domain-containing protein [Gemmatimonadaceae bacterium]